MRNRRIVRARPGRSNLQILIGSALLFAGSGYAIASDPFYPPSTNDPAVVMAAPSELEHRIERLEAHLEDLRVVLQESRAAEEEPQNGQNASANIPAALSQIPAGSKLVGKTQHRAFYRNDTDGRLYSAEYDGEANFPFVIPGAQSNGSAQKGDSE
ncbi:hypothetical protein [Thioalkalivibrio sp. ALE16]|uniref:hypothetical protein n=1 Tax=Thioalkalivibrio sp. ALE16 TaxID=1158172 RepID=UPI00036E2AE5|nr:hypothetical protein [Thioalkalivibrio sp. ALE16]